MLLRKPHCTKAVHHGIAQYKRDESRRPVDLPGDEILAALPANLSPHGTEGPPASLTSEQRRLLEVSLIALEELPPYLTEPYELEVYGRLCPAEIASILGKSPQSTRANLSVARAYVKRRASELLEPGEDDRKGEDG
jgi:DNA-directed RNA polymerase specialized sigma24 family protein